MESIRKKIRIGIAVSAMVCLGVVGQTSALDVSAQNPIVQTAFSPDPAPVVFGDELWVFTGCDRDGNNDFYYMTGWQAFSTTDMQNWTNHGMFLKDNEFSWCNENDAWASQCIERNGKYYFYFTTTNKGGGGRAIGVGVADKPEGPYKDVLGKPLAGPNWDYIDPTVIIDDDGQAWLMFGNPKCYYVKLKEDMVTLDGQIQSFNLQLKSGTKYTEGPWIYKHDSLYYLVFASMVDGFGGESISYCTGPSVTGPWTHRGTIHEGSNCFTTHGGIIDYKGHSYSFYHMNGLPGGGSFNRSAACEEFTYGSDGSIPALKSTKEGPKQIEAFNPYQRIEAETMSWSSGIKAEKFDGGVSIGFIENGDYTKISGVDFGEKGAAEFYASVGSAGDGGKVEVHLDKVDGPIVGTVTVEPTGGWNTFKTVSGKCSGATGTHDVFFRFSGGDSYLFNADWWQFKEVGDSSEVTPGSTTEKEEPGTTTQTTPNTDSGILGDVNGDKVIDAADFSYAKALFIKQETDASKFKAADINCNKKLEKEDIEWYIQYLTGKTDKYLDKVEPDEPEKDLNEFTSFNYNGNVQARECDNSYFNQPQNHGQVIKENYTGINGNKTMYVYVPYGYDKSKKYNVFYLMHGGGENENTCFNDDSINIDIMLDNMIAKGELEPMIVVTPTFNNSPDGSGDVWKEMRQTIIPYVEEKYSSWAKSTSLDDLKASRFHRAYGGFSMGAGSTWRMFCNNLDICAYYMPLSGHSWDGAKGIQDAIDRGGYQKDDYYIFAATGTEDLAYGNMVPLMNELKGDTKRFTYTSDFSKGNLYFMEAKGKVHWWPQVRHYIYVGLPYFFHEGK